MEEHVKALSKYRFETSLENLDDAIKIVTVFSGDCKLWKIKK